VKIRPPLLLAILVYVTLDLSLPAMPGAFVFDPGDSVESVQPARGRTAVEIVPAPVLVLDGPLGSRARVDVTAGRASAVTITPARYRPLTRPPRATLEPAPPAEDSH
jgi:hypothetical protein